MINISFDGGNAPKERFYGRDGNFNTDYNSPSAALTDVSR